MASGSGRAAEVRYARSTGDIDIAYQVVGDGPVDLVFVSGFITHLDMTWELPHIAWLERLDGVARVISFDKRGTGLSDRSLGFGSLEERADDVRAVMDAAGSERAFLLGVSEGGPMSILFAASFPERVHGLALFGTAARFLRFEDYPEGISERGAANFVDFVESRWGTGDVFGTFIQHGPDPEAAKRLIARFERNACTPRMAAEIMRRNLEIDVRPTLSTISAPTVVIHVSDDPIVPAAAGRYLAAHIPGARLVEIPGRFHGSWVDAEVRSWSDVVLDFMAEGGAPTPVRSVNRVLSTVLFTDIAASTETAARVGDDAWHRLLDQHDRVVSAEIARHGGRLVKTTGDGVLATFDGPGRGIGCARAVSGAIRALDLRVRAGVHTGEVELRGDDVTGMGVVIARRICDLAAADEVLVSRTVKDLVTGSGIGLAGRGTHRLKGVPDEWELFAAT